MYSGSSPPVTRKTSVSPFKTTRYSPYKIPQRSSSATQLTGHPHVCPNQPSPSSSVPVISNAPRFTHEGEEFESTRHVKLDFELFRDGEQRFPSAEQHRAIMSLFPTCFKLSFSPPFLVVACTKLPAKPWPVTVAGLPLYLTSDGEAFPMDPGISSRGPKAHVDATITRWQTPDLAIFQKLFTLLDSLDAQIHRLQWIGWSFLALGAKEPFADWRHRLPCQINGIYVGYIFGEQTVQENALRRKLPAGRIPDNEAYTDLRPGVMVASADPESEDHDVMTTSGICLQSPSGKKYLTVAKYGFPGGVGDKVLHPDRHGRCIAQVSKVFGETDIAIAELADVGYLKETFSAPDAPVKAFRNLVNIPQLQVGDSIYMDTPYNGRCEGTLMVVDVLRIPSDEPADDVEYAVGTLGYFGNGADTLSDGCCGGVIWNSQYDVIGQFGFQASGTHDFVYCPTFQTLQVLGYTIASK